jgi:hypothetical protein
MALSFGPNYGKQYGDTHLVLNKVVRMDGSNTMVPLIGDENGLLVQGAIDATVVLPEVLDVLVTNTEAEPVPTHEVSFEDAADLPTITLVKPGPAVQAHAGYPCKAVLLFSPVTNTGAIYWGFSVSTANKYIGPGGHVLLPVADVSMVYVDGLTNGETVLVSVLGPN